MIPAWLTETALIMGIAAAFVAITAGAWAVFKLVGSLLAIRDSVARIERRLGSAENEVVAVRAELKSQTRQLADIQTRSHQVRLSDI
jgi:ABC-type phosphate transport system auxiliary subunit